LIIERSGRKNNLWGLLPRSEPEVVGEEGNASVNFHASLVHLIDDDYIEGETGRSTWSAERGAKKTVRDENDRCQRVVSLAGHPVPSYRIPV
jgi:hypothetical protein